MIPGLDYLIVQRITAIGGTASQAKLQILRQANVVWVANGSPADQVMNVRIWLSLSSLPPPTQLRSITAGQPGFFSPATATIPTFAALQGMHPPREQINPLSPWPVADWVVAAGGELCSWTGFQWVVKP